jgi:anti-sigma regulatory factor (Ser/Thr protein kinase)
MMKELVVQAALANFTRVRDFIDEQLEEHGCPMKHQLQIAVAVEELFVNIANYAYAPGSGTARISAEIGGDPKTLTLTFEDSGKPYNPLLKEDPDISAPTFERPIGGLGIFLVKKHMDDLEYEYSNGKNILTIKKVIGN